MHTNPLLFVCIGLALVIGVLLFMLFRSNKLPAKKSHLNARNINADLRDEQLKFEVIINTIEDGVVLVDD